MSVLGHIGSNQFAIVHLETVVACGGDTTQAFLLSWIHYRLGANGANVHTDENGQRWWRITQTDIARELGVAYSQPKVSRKLSALENSGLLMAVKHHLEGATDQTKSYRPATPDHAFLHKRESGGELAGQVAEMGSGSDCAKMHDVPSIKKSLNNKIIHYSDDFERWWKLYPRAPGRNAPSKSVTWNQYRKAVQECDPGLLLARMEAYRATFKDDFSYVKNPDKWLRERYWDVEPAEDLLAPLVEARDADGIQRLTGMRCPFPAWPDLSPREAAAKRVEFFDVWVSTSREALEAAVDASRV